MSDAWDDDQHGPAPAATDAVEVNEPDLIEQHRPVDRDPGARAVPTRLRVSDDPEVSVADAWEQALPVAGDEEY